MHSYFVIKTNALVFHEHCKMYEANHEQFILRTQENGATEICMNEALPCITN